MPSEEIIQFTNCRILRNHRIIKEDLWVRNGKIIDPEILFFVEKKKCTVKIECNNMIIAPGFIDIQINGGFGIDFSSEIDKIEQGIATVAKGLLQYGVTSFCPTIVTSPAEVYHKILPKIERKKGGSHGATVLGVHLEGPFINPTKKGAHPENHVQVMKNFQFVYDTYGYLENCSIITLAPEADRKKKVISKLASLGIKVALGHSMGNLSDGEAAVRNGACLITHLFNAMLPFHHRDPGLIGLLASDNIPKYRIIYYGIIADNVHTHPAALRIAYKTHSEGLILVTDAISAMGLNEGKHSIGILNIEIRNSMAFIANSDTLCGSIATMDECVKNLFNSTNCSLSYALETAALHPAKCLGINQTKGTLNFDADADFIILNDDIAIASTWIAGKCVWKSEDSYGISITYGYMIPCRNIKETEKKTIIRKPRKFRSK